MAKMVTPITDEQVAELEVAHGRVAHCKGKGGSWECVFRKPKRAEYKAFRSKSHGSGKADALEALAKQTVVFPSALEFEAMLEDYPGIPEACADVFMTLAGMVTEESEK